MLDITCRVRDSTATDSSWTEQLARMHAPVDRGVHRVFQYHNPVEPHYESNASSDHRSALQCLLTDRFPVAGRRQVALQASAHELCERRREKRL